MTQATWTNRIVGHGEESPDQLLANPKNFRLHPKHQQDALAGVLEEVGIVQNVIVNQRTGFLLDGHLRVSLALRQGQPTIPVVYVDLDEGEEALVLSTLDPISALAGTDAAKLDELLADVTTGSAAVQAMLDTLAESAGLYPDAARPGAGGDEFDTTPDDTQTRVQRGDLWQMGRHRLLVDDCSKSENIERLMEGRRARLAWFDPPFGIDLVPQRGLTKIIANDGREEAKVLWRNFLPLIERTLEENTVAFLCQGWSEFDWTLPLVREHFTIKSKVVWHKTQWGIGYYFRPQHEDILYCWKGTPEKPQEAISDVWSMARPSAPEHAAEKPVTLSQTAIEFASKAGDVVVDWFAGVGGSCIAAERTSREWYGMELDPNHAAVILRRWEAETGQQAVKLDELDDIKP